jgi:hypothetical protein
MKNNKSRLSSSFPSLDDDPEISLALSTYHERVGKMEGMPITHALLRVSCYLVGLNERLERWLDKRESAQALKRGTPLTLDNRASLDASCDLRGVTATYRRLNPGISELERQVLYYDAKIDGLLQSRAKAAEALRSKRENLPI